MIIVEAVSPALRGQLSRLMVEPHPGVFAGHLSARVRDRLWERILRGVGDGSAVLIHPARNEQGFSIRTAGRSRRQVVDYDGIQLVRLRATSGP